MSHAQTFHAVARAAQIDAAGALLDADLVVPADAVGVVVFAQGAGSGRRSPRNRHVAERLQEAGFATLLVDLLTPQQALADALGARHRLDIPLLARRLAAATRWLGGQPETRALPVSCFAAGTGLAAALVVAAEEPALYRGVVARSGRADLARDALEQVKTPVLLLAGGNDTRGVKVAARAAERLKACDVVVIPGAGRLFEEPGAMELVATVARGWLNEKVTP